MKKFKFINKYGYSCYINLDEVASYYILDATYGKVLKVVFKNNNQIVEYVLNEKYAKEDLRTLEKLILENE